MKQEDYIFVSDILDTISKTIEVGYDKKYLKSLILGGYSAKYVDRYFKEVVGYTIDYYIRLFYYLRYFHDWQKSPKDEKQRNTYKGFKYFGYYFKRELGSDLKEANLEQLINDAQMGEEGLKRLRDEFLTMQFITGITFKGEAVTVTLMPSKFLELVLSEKTFFIPRDLFKVKGEDIEPYEVDKLLLSIYEDEIETYEADMGRLGGYSLDESEENGSWCVWRGNIPEELDQYLGDVLWKCRERIEIDYPNGMALPKEYDILKDFFENEYSQYHSFELLEKRLGKSTEEILGIMVQMAKRGLLRLRRIEMVIEKEYIEEILEEKFEDEKILDEQYGAECYTEDFVVQVKEMTIEPQTDTVVEIRGRGVVSYDIYEMYWAGDYDDEGNCWDSENIGYDTCMFDFTIKVMDEDFEEVIVDIEPLNS